MRTTAQLWAGAVVGRLTQAHTGEAAATAGGAARRLRQRASVSGSLASGQLRPPVVRQLQPLQHLRLLLQQQGQRIVAVKVAVTLETAAKAVMTSEVAQGAAARGHGHGRGQGQGQGHG